MQRQSLFLACLLSAVLAGLGPQPARASKWDLQMPGMSQHFEKPRQRGADWNQRHDGFGLQRTVELDQDRRSGGWVWRDSVGVMLDSYGNQSGYISGQIAWRQQGARFNVDSGLSPMLLYRTTQFDRAGHKAPMRLIPALLPTITIEDRRSGIGANLIAVPGMDLGPDLRLPGLVFIQFTRPIE